MKFLASLLGKMPASDSAAWNLNTLDWKKILRMALVVFAGAFSLKVSGTQLTDSNLSQVLLDAANAGITALGAAAFEAIRRLVTNNRV